MLWPPLRALHHLRTVLPCSLRCSLRVVPLLGALLPAPLCTAAADAAAAAVAAAARVAATAVSVGVNAADVVVPAATAALAVVVAPAVTAAVVTASSVAAALALSLPVTSTVAAAAVASVAGVVVTAVTGAPRTMHTRNFAVSSGEGADALQFCRKSHTPGKVEPAHRRSDVIPMAAKRTAVAAESDVLASPQPENKSHQLSCSAGREVCGWRYSPLEHAPRCCLRWPQELIPVKIAYQVPVTTRCPWCSLRHQSLNRRRSLLLSATNSRYSHSARWNLHPPSSLRGQLGISGHRRYCSLPYSSPSPTAYHPSVH